jgi:subtilisin-like proprotein convertase family protein
MRKLLVLCLTLALVFTTLVLPSRSNASPEGKGAKSAAPGTRKIGQDPAANVNPLMYRAVNFGESRPVSELAAAQRTLAPRDVKRVQIKDHEEVIEKKLEQNKGGGKEDLMRDGEDVLREKNHRNAEVTRKFDAKIKTAPDAALARVPEGRESGLAPQVMPTPNVSFEAVSLTDTTALPGQGFLPPDTVGEVGPNHFVQMVNSAFRIYSRTGTPLIPLTSIGALFSTIPGPCAGNEDGDPIVMYDQLADRWLLSEFCTVANPNNHQLIAVSKTGDPTGAYYLYDFMMPNNKFNDYPHFGVWSDAYMMTDNEFNQAGTQFLGAGMFAFDRAKMIAGDPTASYIYFDKAEGCPAACLFGGMLPADLDGFTPPPAGAPAPVMQFDADENGVGTPDQLRIFDFHSDFVTPANSTLTERTGSPLAVAAFDPREVPAGSRNVIPQPPGGVSVDAISDRLMYRLAYRNFGDHESLVMNHTVNAAVNPVFRAGVRYYEIRKTTPAGAWTVQEQGTMSGAVGDTEHRWMGSTALNGSGSQAVGYSVSSTTVFPSIRYAGRLAGDPAGSLAQGEATLVAGTATQTHSSGRWGDYSDLTVDPTDDCTFWYTTEYVTGAAAPDNTRWHTRIGSFQFGPCAPVQKGILNGTVTSSAGGAPVANATVSAGPFIRNSNASGVYNIDPMGTGTYTLTVSAPGYVTKTIPGVSIAQGGTTVQNVQLDPQNVLQGGTPVITAESCVPANLALDPGETVTVNLPIVNNGGAGATTSNLVATLQAVGGVSSPSGPQTYGAVAQGAAAVVKSFTFTISASCGQVVDITLQLQDGATNYGTVVYSLRTGTLGAPSTALYATGNIATPIPDVNTVDIPITVAATGAVSDVNVRVRLNHTFDADLTLTLIAPDNTAVTLAANRDTATGGGDNYGTGANDCSGTPTIFDDAAAQPISAGLPPFAGTFQPETPLAAFNGKSITGTWKLRVNDNATLDTGTVGCVTLEISRQPFICCGVSGTPVMSSGGAATITAESISPANNAPDPGETVTATFPLVNTGDGNTTALVATVQASGGVTPVGPPTIYGVVTAGGPAVSQPISFVASGTCGNNITVTLQLTDGAVSLGTAAYTFRLGTTSTSSQTFSNVTAIVIPATGTGAATGAPATPYPSAITVAGVTNPVTKVRVTLKQISHTFPSDVDVLLVGPTGVKFTLMSDVIGGTDWTGQTYTFDDDAAAILPSSGAPPASGSFKPTNYGTGDAFPAPAPAAPYLDPATAGTATLSGAFGGLNPNGTWNLYVVDDAGTDIGTFAGGWDLTLVSTQSVCNAQTCSITCPANITVPADISGTGAVVNYPGASVLGACGVLGYSTPSGSTFPVGTTQVNVTGANAAACSFNVTVTPTGGSTQNLIISEFRLRGPNGANDEFVELYNNSDSPLNVSTTDASAGWALAASAGGTRFTVPNGTVIPARGHYLGVNSVGYSLASYPAGNGTTATGDATYTTDIPDNAGLALFNTANPANFTLANRLDAVGSAVEANTLYKEGTGYVELQTFAIDYSWNRILTTGTPKDTNNNSADFLFADINATCATVGGSATCIGNAGPHLGAPGPENLSSPIQRNATVKASLIDPTVNLALPPNRVRDFIPGPAATSTFGTLELRRKFTNNTGASVSRLRFRIVDITTFPAVGTADLRPITSVDSVVVTSGGPVTVRGTTLDQPASQPNGGGFNSSMSAGTVTLATPLANGASINMRFVLGVQAAGSFRFFINVEALP